jgi:HEAT repeat protein
MRAPSVLLAAILLLGASRAGAPAQDGVVARTRRAPSPTEIASDVRTILLGIKADEPLSTEILTKRLIGLGASTTSFLLEALETGTVPAQEGSLPGSAEPMDASREAAAIKALSLRTRGELHGPALEVLGRASGAHTTAIVVRLLGAVGDRRDLDMLCGLVRPSGDEFVDGELSDAFESAVADILTREAAASTTAKRLLRNEADSVRWSLIRALGAASTESTLSVLAADLGAEPRDDGFLLEQLSLSAISARRPVVPEAVRHAVRRYLRSPEPDFVSKAAKCLASMEDTESVADLVALLRHEDSSTVIEVHAALAAVTRVSLIPDPDRWERWLAEEKAWLANDFPRLADEVRSDSPVLVSQAIAQFTTHPLYRREITDVLQLELDGQPISVRRMACSAFQQLGATTAVALLERWAEDPDRGLALEARRVLGVLAPGRAAIASEQTSLGRTQGEIGSRR